MSTSFMGFGFLLISLPVLIAQWVGILGLGKRERNGAWWCMFSGICCTTFGSIVSTLFIGLMMAGISSHSYGPGVSIALSTGLSGLGTLLFAVGFAIHGQQASKVKQRIADLEAIAAAQGEELNRQRPNY